MIELEETVREIRILFGYYSDHSRQIVEQILKEEFPGIELLTTNNLRTFGGLIRQKKPHIVLAEVAGTKEYKEDILRLSLSENPRIPVVIIVPATEEQAAIEAVKRGAADYVLEEYPGRLPFTIRHIMQKGRPAKNDETISKLTRTQQSHLEASFNNTNDLIVALDTRSSVVKFNQAFENWCVSQYGQPPVAGQPVQKFIHPDTVRQLEHAMNEALTGVAFQSEHKYPSGKGMLHFETFLSPVFERGRVIGVTSRTHNITARDHRLVELNRTQRELRLKNKIDQCFLTVKDKQVHTTVMQLIAEAFHSPLNLLGFIKNKTAFEIDTLYASPEAGVNIPVSTPLIFPKENWIGVWKKVLHDRKTYIQEGNFVIPENHPVISRILVAPLIYQGELVGVIHLANKPEPYTEDDYSLITSLSDHLAPIFIARRLQNEEEHQRLQAEKARSESERRLELLMNNLPGIAYRCRNDKEWTMEFVSAGCYPLTGYQPDELIANRVVSFNDLILEEYRQYIWDKWQEVLPKHEVFKDTYQIKTATGKIKWVWEQGQGVYDSEGNLIALEGFITDITEQREYQNLIHESEQKYRQLFETMVQGVIYKNREGNITKANPAACRILGLSYAGETIPEPDWTQLQAIHEDGTPFPAPEHPSAIALKTAKPVKDVKMGFINSSTGERKWININATPQFAEGDNTPTGVYATFEDITVMHEAAAKIQQARDDAHKAGILKDSFIANISHEIRTPLNALLGFSELLQSEINMSEEENVEKFISAINKAGLRLMRSMDLILNYSRTQAGDYPIHPGPVDIYEFIKNQYDNYLEAAKLRKLDFTLEAMCQDTFIIADEYSLRIAFDNLIDNALKYTPQGSVDIKIYCRDQQVCVEISDTGIGMAPGFVEKLFVPYIQEDTGPNRAYEGLGLGLSLTRILLEYNYATIEVKSEKDKGSCFTVSFPNPVIPTDLENNCQDNNTITMEPAPVILVVEDDASSQYYMEVILQKSYRPIIAATDKEAFQALEKEKVAMVLMDISLKESTNGLEITRVMRNTPKYANIPVIAVTAHAFPADKQRSLEAGCNEYLSKPVKKRELLRIISKYLETS